MEPFPFDMVDQIVSTKKTIKNKIEVAQENRKNEFDKLSKELDNMKENHHNAILNANEAKSTLSSDKESHSQALIQKREELQKQKDAYEKTIKNLRDQIQKADSDSNIVDKSACLSIIQSIAPVKFTTISSNRLAGIISFGTPSSTESFDFNRLNSDEIPSKFWNQLLRCSNARYNNEQSSLFNNWSNNDELAW